MNWLASIVLTVLTAGGVWLGLVLLAIVMTGAVGLALIIYLDSRPISRHGQCCTCFTCYQAEMAAIAPQRAAALAAATVRQAEAITNPYLRVGDQWYRKVPRDDGRISVARCTPPEEVS